ncbi:MAG: ATPase, T2SS/T4P/T4SS family [Phycisphaerae bacterium]|nr:ATPase, T2SS/T4P/T4SS family [Phycisphaerae bacterium]
MIEKIKKLINSTGMRFGDGHPPRTQSCGGKMAGLTTIYLPQNEVESTNGMCVRDVADTLVGMGRVTNEQLSEVRGEQLKNVEESTSEILLRLGYVDKDDILAARAHISGLEFRHIRIAQIDRDAFEKLDIGFIASNRIMPIAFEDNVLTTATAEPENVFALDEVKLRTGMDVNVVVCSNADIDTAINALGDGKADYGVEAMIADIADVEVVQDAPDKIEDLEKMAGESPVIKFVNYLISYAIKQGASDIHIEPKGKETKIRYRIDGVLFEEMTPPAQMHAAMVSRLKIMSNLDISERRLPQDGKISVIVGGRGIDLRVSSLPTSHGEKVVIRVLDSQSILRGLDNSGMDPATMRAFIEQIHKPNGILLVTGPTGSGKSTTLYSSLGLMDGKRLNISTVEDPVEYELEFANQVNVNDRIGMTFSAALRSLLRQDPDIIMVGEIRDAETARIAVQAALTGHLVLSTLHTNDAPSSITRLVNIGIEPYLISASLNAVLAQRLVRKICPNCKVPYKLPDNLRKHMTRAGIEPGVLYRGAGCDNCRKSGYVGRTGIYELLIVDEQVKSIINKSCSTESIKSVFNKTGVLSLYQDGIRKVKEGITTIEEVLRVTEAYDQKPE